MRYLILTICLLFYGLGLSGCTTFTQEDYDLQKKKYERDQKAEEQRAKESVYLKW